MSVVGILIVLGLLVWLAYRGWSILLLAPLCALIAAFLASQPLLANWTQTFMSNDAARCRHHQSVARAWHPSPASAWRITSGWRSCARRRSAALSCSRVSGFSVIRGWDWRRRQQVAAPVFQLQQLVDQWLGGSALIVHPVVPTS